MSAQRSTVRHFTTIGLFLVFTGCTASGGGCAPLDQATTTTTTTTTTEVDASTTSTTIGPGSTTSTTVAPESTTTTTTQTTVPGDGGLTAIASVAVEDCITPADDNTFISQVSVVDCDVPHTAEVYAQFNLDRDELPGTGGDYPGGSELDWYAQDECQARFEGYTGHSYWTSQYDLRTVTPSFSTWDVGDRSITCLLVAGDGTALTTSARG